MTGITMTSAIDGNDAKVAVGVLVEKQNSTAGPWNCHACTYSNSEAGGKFCCMCGSPRFGDDAENTGDTPNVSQNHRHGIPEQPLRYRPSPTKESSSANTLDTSMSFHGLPDESIDSTGEGDNSMKEFQMSFANWSPMDRQAWTCKVCTFVNTNSLHLQCEVCGTNRPKSSSHHHDEGQSGDLEQTQESIEKEAQALKEALYQEFRENELGRDDLDEEEAEFAAASFAQNWESGSN